MRTNGLISWLPSDEELDLLLRHGVVDLCSQPIAPQAAVRLRTRLIQLCRQAEPYAAPGDREAQHAAPVASPLMMLDLLRPFALRTIMI